jgi:hypothetical protein
MFVAQQAVVLEAVAPSMRWFFVLFYLFLAARVFLFHSVGSSNLVAPHSTPALTISLQNNHSLKKHKWTIHIRPRVHRAQALTGTIFTVNAQRVDALQVPASFAKLRIWRHTAVAALKEGEDPPYTTFRGVLGHEWDEDVDNGFRLVTAL